MSQNKPATKDELHKAMVHQNLKIPNAHTKIMENQVLLAGNIGQSLIAHSEVITVLENMANAVNRMETHFKYLFDQLVEKKIIEAPPIPRKNELLTSKKEISVEEKIKEFDEEIKNGK